VTYSDRIKIRLELDDTNARESLAALIRDIEHSQRIRRRFAFAYCYAVTFVAGVFTGSWWFQ
jgi:hypothetical protein